MVKQSPGNKIDQVIFEAFHPINTILCVIEGSTYDEKRGQRLFVKIEKFPALHSVNPEFTH